MVRASLLKPQNFALPRPCSGRTQIGVSGLPVRFMPPVVPLRTTRLAPERTARLESAPCVRLERGKSHFCAFPGPPTG